MGEESYENSAADVPEDIEERASWSDKNKPVWGDVDDITALTQEELRSLLSRFDEEEKVVSYRRRVLQGRIDVIRAEIVRRGEASLSPEDLARVLMGDVGVGEADPKDEPEGTGGGA